MKYLFGLSLFILLFPWDLWGQQPVLIEDDRFRQVAQTAIDSLYNRNPDAARELLEPWRQNHPDHPLWTLWSGMEYWWVVLTDLHDTSHDDHFITLMEQADSEAAALLREHADHPDAYIIRAVANGYIARQYSNRHRWVRSIRAAVVAQRSHTHLGAIMPDFPDVLFAEGIKLYYAAYLPENYTLVRAVSWLLPAGDRKEGLNLLEKASREAVFSRPEAVYFLGNIQLNYEEDPGSAIVNFRQLTDRYPDNIYYRRLLVRALFRQGSHAEAMDQIDEALTRWDGREPGEREVLAEELLYWRGRIQLQMGRDESAFEDLARSHELGFSLPGREQRSFHILSGYSAGVAAERNSDLETARNYYEAVVDLEGELDVRSRAKARLEDL